MNLNPLRLLGFGRKNLDGAVGAATREAQPLGAWSGALGGWVPRQCNPYLYEALREAIPMLDAGVSRLVTMDGILEVEGDKQALVDEIAEWMGTVPVNDTERGYQAFYASAGNELYEQGFAVGEAIPARNGRDVAGLRVADSKGVIYLREKDRIRVFYRAPSPVLSTRNDGLENVETLLRGGVRRATVESLAGLGFVELNPLHLVTAVHNPEADNPYGTSVMRSLPFVAQILLKMENATGRAWERFGDPIFHVHYGTKNRKLDAAAVSSRAQEIVNSLGTAMAAKARGQSVDIATGTAADDEVSINVVGANGAALDLDLPFGRMIEQLTSAFGLPAWMLGVQAAAVQGMSEQQAELVMQDAKTRFMRRKPGLEQPIATMLRARGRTWKPGDWRLVQRLPNLMDEAKRAQAGFLRAQTALMLGERGEALPPEAGQGIDNGLRAALREHLAKAGSVGDAPPLPEALQRELERRGL